MKQKNKVDKEELKRLKRIKGKAIKEQKIVKK